MNKIVLIKKNDSDFNVKKFLQLNNLRETPRNLVVSMKKVKGNFYEIIDLKKRSVETKNLKEKLKNVKTIVMLNFSMSLGNRFFEAVKKIKDDINFVFIDKYNEEWEDIINVLDKIKDYPKKQRLSVVPLAYSEVQFFLKFDELIVRDELIMDLNYIFK